MEIKCRKISGGFARGITLVSKDSISFYGGVNPDTGIVIEKDHCLEGKCIASKILVFPSGKGSTVGSYILHRLKKNGKAPLALINSEAEPIVAVGAIISDIPMVDRIDINKIKNNIEIEVIAGKEKAAIRLK